MIHNVHFLKNHNISDCYIVALETLYLLFSSHLKGVMIKLDFEKVFDNVNWNFLINALAGFGFSSKWISWIKICIHSAKFSILINGAPKGYFGTSNGLRHMDPLSPLLFIIVTYILNRVLCLGKENHLIKGIPFSHNGSDV